jgi:DNA-binding transcriptional MerR regulator/methylmalonyl-CoA mutase cobalamin-binding subunit
VYTIKQAAIRTGLPIPTIRAWERRYGVVHPVRTAAGYRLYDDESMDRLSAMRQLVEVEGMRPSQAADRVRAGGADVSALAARARQAVAGDGGTSGMEPGAPVAPAVDALREATRRLDIPAMERLLDEAFAAQRFEAAASNVVYPALRAIGDDWAQGTIDVAMEHAASETIRRRLARFYDAALDLSSPLDVIVGLPPGCQHDIGAMGFAVAARRGGLSVLYLGANVPVPSWVRTADAVGAPAAVVGAIVDRDVPSATDVVTSLLASAARPAVFVGGRAAPAVAQATGVIALPAHMDAAVDVVRQRLRSSRPA